MQTKKKMKTVSLDAMIDKHVGKIGSSARDTFEHELKLDLLGNAIKFTEKGFVALSIRASRDQFRFEVIDSGIGIPLEAKAKLFQSFTQTDDSISRKYGGTGLGLSISKAIVEKMGGKIWLDSAPGTPVALALPPFSVSLVCWLRIDAASGVSMVTSPPFRRPGPKGEPARTPGIHPIS